MSISNSVRSMIHSSSFIRMMFETGANLKKEFGENNVFDFSLGNPNINPPRRFTEVLYRKAVDNSKHCYMPNAGFQDVRTQVANYVSKEQKVTLYEDSVIMTCGAGGALNIALKTILNPGDEVIASTPCFMEYKYYCNNHGGELKLVDCKKDFDLDIENIEESITDKTVAVIINSPNNPSGRVYPEETIKELGQMLERKSNETGRVIYLISDEPYRKIVFDDTEVPPVLCHYENSMVCTSFSKDLSLPGERIGYLTLNPYTRHFSELISGMVLCNRILGYVNAPALMQRTVADLLGVSVDIDDYKRKRDIICEALSYYGYSFRKPEGTFYLFVEVPDGNDLNIVEMLLEEKILVVPGRGFGMPGYFRIAFCVEDSVIDGALKGFERVADRLNLKIGSYSV